MVAQLLHDRLGLGPHLRQEILGLRIDAAGKGEILPDHDAVLVAQVEEAVVLVDVAAPAADHVAAQVGEEPDSLFVPPGIAAVEGIERHPVGTLDHDRLAVDIDHEMAIGLRRDVDARGVSGWLVRPRLTGRGGAIDHYGAEANALRALVKHLAVLPQLCGHRVEVGSAIALRPP